MPPNDNDVTTTGPLADLAPEQELDNWDEQVDLLVLGTGAGGLSAAVTAAEEGLSTLVLEKTEFLGGTTAYSAGTCWIPNNRFQRAAGVTDDVEVAGRYLDELVGDKAPRDVRESYLINGSAAIDYFDGIGVGFWHSKTVVDYHPDVPGASLGGRALEPQTFDGRRLGKENFSRVRPPVPEFALFGGTMMVRRAEVNQLLTMLQGSLKPSVLALKLGARWAKDRLSYRRGTRLAMGNALVANLFHKLLERDGQVWFDSTATRLLTDDRGRVTGAVVAYRGRELRVRARRGVVLAGGGFSADADWRTRYLPNPTPQYTRAAEGSTGDTLSLATAVGGTLSEPRDDNAFWFPSSIGRRRDGSTAVFPHIWDRAKPGIVAVNADGRRFVDESVSYHRFTRAMYESNSTTPTVPAWLVIDSRALNRYGLGMIRPKLPKAYLRKYLKSGYLQRGNSIRELAAMIGVDPDGLDRTVTDNNRYARTGVDDQFGKGTSPFGLQYGDPNHRPNPNLGPIDRAPYYAIALVPTPLGTSLGLRINAEAQVLDATDAPIPGLYAVGNDAASMSASEYPGAGCQVGAGLTFGYVAARHAIGTRDFRLGGQLSPAPPAVTPRDWAPPDRSIPDMNSDGDLVNPYPVLSGETLVVPIIGDPIAQVKSPDGITRAFASRGVNAVVVPLQIASDDFDALVRSLGASGSVGGMIATVPHKFGLAAQCATLTDRARFLGSVNVARRNADGTWHGDQVDGAAYVAAIQAAGGDPAGRRVLQVGAGGAGSAIALALLESGAAELALHDADPERRDGLIERLRTRFGDRVVAGSDDPAGFDMIAHATPMGMRADDPYPVEVQRLTPNTFVADVVTKPAVPPLIEADRGIGCGTSTGADMFAAVAVLIVDFLVADGPLTAA